MPIGSDWRSMRRQELEQQQEPQGRASIPCSCEMKERKLDAVGWPILTPDRSQCSEADLLEEQVEMEFVEYGFVTPATQAAVALLSEQDRIPGYRRPRDYSWLTDLPHDDSDTFQETLPTSTCGTVEIPLTDPDIAKQGKECSQLQKEREQPVSGRYSLVHSSGIKLVLTTLASVTACIAFVLMADFVWWWLALAILIAWTPLAFKLFSSYMSMSTALAVWFVFVAVQSVHLSEHLAQMVQIHLLGRTFAMSHGILGGTMFDVEWFHFFFDTGWIPFNTIILLVMLHGRDKWLWIMWPIVGFYAAEHIQIISDYLSTGITGTPGLLGAGGHIHWFLSISRPDLHFTYNLLEEIPMLLGFFAYRQRLFHASKSALDMPAHKTPLSILTGGLPVQQAILCISPHWHSHLPEETPQKDLSRTKSSCRVGLLR